MAKKKVTKSSKSKKSTKTSHKKKTSIKNIKQKIAEKGKITAKKREIKKKNVPTLKLKSESEIAMDFALKVYKTFEKSIKSIVLFGSQVKGNNVSGSDIDIIIVIDDVSIRWDQEMIAWYREEMDKILKSNPYNKDLHINTIKLSTWWQDLMRGDPVILNVIRYGQALIDLAGFFEPMKFLLSKGLVKSTPEAIYSALQRAPTHLQRSKLSQINSVEGIYWCMVDAAQAALISANVNPPSPEHIPVDLKEHLVDQGMLNGKYVTWYRDMLILHKKIAHGEVKQLKGIEIDEWQERAEEFLRIMTGLVKDLMGF